MKNINQTSGRVEVKNDFSRKPNGFLLCLGIECPKREQCLRYLAYSQQPKPTTLLRVYNPKYLGQFAECPAFRYSAPVRHARGMIRGLSQMNVEDHSRFINLVKMHMDRRKYFRIRRGEDLVTPAQQQLIDKLYEQVTGQPHFPFSAYEESPLW